HIEQVFLAGEPVLRYAFPVTAFTAGYCYPVTGCDLYPIFPSQTHFPWILFFSYTAKTMWWP
ncbi:MAG TPA: hypothetical protein PKE63_13645, partial [Lacibacter sp.]|nr:hypothetical protein [Lacibacter sp.]